MEALEHEWMSAHSEETITMDRLAEVRADIVRQVRELRRADELRRAACVTDSNRKGVVADLLAVMQDRDVLRVLQTILANSSKDQSHLATTSSTAFRFVSKAHLSMA